MTQTRREILAAGPALAAGTMLGAAAPSGWAMPAAGAVEQVPLVAIAMRDGTILRGRLWLPAEPARRPAPVVLEYIPYRTRDSYSAADDHWGKVLASFGIGYARIDLRGSGDSDGLLRDEYLAVEQDDALEVIAWLDAQPWCNGAVGMRGISWGGFSTLQAAMRRPPALKAIMPMACSDRRFTDDAHFVGGCLGLTNFKWGINFKAVMAAPPDPAIVGPRWEEMWRTRLEASPAIIARWAGHAREDAYWQHGSLHFDYAAIRCPTYVVGGWADAYVHSVPRMLERLSCPRKALVGPWGHTYPWLGGPGPALDWAHEEVRWWTHWLRGEETGIMAEPMLRFHLPDAVPAQSAPGATPGHWATEPAWPSPRVRSRRYHLTDAGLSPVAGKATRRTHRSHNRVGLDTPEWAPFGMQEMAGDQRDDDARSLVYDLAPLAADMQLLGVPRVRLRIAADRPQAQLAMRLCKVLPDGSSWRLGYGLLDLALRDGFDTRRPLTPGAFFDVTLDLGFVAQRLHAGERLRLAISEGLWPLVWPSPEPVALTIDAARCTLDLPVRAAPPVEPVMPIAEVAIAPDPGQVVVRRQVEGDRATVTGRWPDRSRECANGTILSGFGPNTTATIVADRPETCHWSGEHVSRYRRGDWDCSLRTSFDVTAAPGGWAIEERIEAESGGRRIFERTRRNTISR